MDNLSTTLDVLGVKVREAVVRQNLYAAHPEAASWCMKGLDLFRNGFDEFHGTRLSADVDAVRQALLIRSWNTLHCAFECASRGYYLQSYNLLRTPLEDWVAYWYLREFPKKARTFTDPNLHAPRLHAMLDELEKIKIDTDLHLARIQAKMEELEKMRGDPNFDAEQLHAMSNEIEKLKGELNPARLNVTRGARDLVQILNQFSHVDGSGVVMTYHRNPTEGVVVFNLGPGLDPDMFLMAALGVVAQIGKCLLALNDLRELRGLSILPEFDEYFKASDPWFKQAATQITPIRSDNAAEHSGTE